MQTIITEALLAAGVLAALVLCGLNLDVSMPASVKTILTQRLMVKISVCNIARKSQQQEHRPVNIKLAERLADSITSIKSTKIIWAKRFGRTVISVAIEIPKGSPEAPDAVRLLREF